MDRIAWDACGRTYRIDASYAGRVFRCHCGQIVHVPPDAVEPAFPAPLAASH